MKQPNNTIYNTALYMRLNRDDELQGESGSIQTQRMMLRQFAREQNLNVVGEYIDDGWSGTNFDRPDFQRMIDGQDLVEIIFLLDNIPRFIFLARVSVILLSMITLIL